MCTEEIEAYKENEESAQLRGNDRGDGGREGEGYTCKIIKRIQLMLKSSANIKFHLQALDRMKERGATKEEVIATVYEGENITAKFGRKGFRRNFEGE